MAKFIQGSAFESYKRLGISVVAALITALALNLFLTPANVFQAGATGVAQLISLFLQRAGLPFGDMTGWFNILLNIPLVILAWKTLGRRFTVYSMITSGLISLFVILMPVHTLTDNPLMNAIFGGVLTGVGVGLALRNGYSTGGFDILSMFLAKTTRYPVGVLMFAVNFLIVIVAGLGIQWESALYTIISIYCMTRVVDTIHTANELLTAFIVTEHEDAVVAALKERLVRGITVLDSEGGYMKRASKTIMVAVSRYELYDLTAAAHAADPQAFIDVVATKQVFGEFLSQDQQHARRQRLPQ